MFKMMSLSNDQTERNNFFAQTLENSRVLIYLLFNEFQTSLFCPRLKNFSRLACIVSTIFGLKKRLQQKAK